MNLANLFQFALSSAVICLAAHWLVKASDEIAKTTGLGYLFVGSIFLAASTSAPEFFVDIRATIRGLPNLAAGDLLGSSLVNLSIFSILIYWRSAQDQLKDSSLSALLAAVLTAKVGLMILIQSGFGIFGFSLGSYAIILTYLNPA